MRSSMLADRDERGDEDEAGEEDELSLVTSDVIKPPQPKVRKTLSSAIRSSQPVDAAGMSQQTVPPTTDTPSPSASRMRLAVHIRSSPIKSFTPINVPATVPSKMVRGRGRPPRSQTPTKPSTPDALPKPGVNIGVPDSQPKKRGRPKGWKPGTPYTTDSNSRNRKREMKVTGESKAGERIVGQSKDWGQKQEIKRRGRPARPPELNAREQYLQSKPDYTPYKCEWRLSDGSPQQEPSLCPAELQNMETLRRHVLLIHGDEDPLVCRFPHCRDRDPPLHFKTEDEFKDHMETKHFVKYLWYLGEGYQNNGMEALKRKADELPDYLFDKDGNQVTPSVADQRLETDLQKKERKRKLRRLLYEQNENAPSEEEWMQQMLGYFQPEGLTSDGL